MQREIEVALVDDEGVLRGAIAHYLTSRAGLRVVYSGPTWPEFQLSEAFPADVVLLDLDLKDGMSAEPRIRTATSAGAKVVVLSSFQQPHVIMAAIEAGAFNYIPKAYELDQVEAAIRDAAADEAPPSPELAKLMVGESRPTKPRLSKQEVRILTLWASNLTAVEIGKQIYIAADTVNDYLSRIRRKYAEVGRAATSKLDLHRRAVEDGYVAIEVPGTNPVTGHVE